MQAAELSLLIASISIRRPLHRWSRFNNDDTDCEEPRQNSPEYIHIVPHHHLRKRSHADNATSLGAFSDSAMAAFGVANHQQQGASQGARSEYRRPPPSPR